jgi:hypothetical protein
VPGGFCTSDGLCGHRKVVAGSSVGGARGAWRPGAAASRCATARLAAQPIVHGVGGEKLEAMREVGSRRAVLEVRLEAQGSGVPARLVLLPAARQKSARRRDLPVAAVLALARWAGGLQAPRVQAGRLWAELTRAPRAGGGCRGEGRPKACAGLPPLQPGCVTPARPCGLRLLSCRSELLGLPAGSCG